MLVTHRWYSLAVIVTLALGIGINTTVFTLVNAVLFKPVPIPGGERLVTVVSRSTESTERREDAVSYPDFQTLQSENRTFEGLEAGSPTEAVLSDTTQPPERYRAMRITPSLFNLLKTPPVLGRALSSEDGRPGTNPVVLLGHALWQSRYAGASDVIGRAVRVNGSPATIVGVMPPGFKFPSNEEFWVTLVPDAELQKRAARSLILFGLLNPGVSVQEANADLAVIASRLAAEFPDTNKERGVEVRTFHDTYNGQQIRVVFLMMLGAVSFVLLIACANVANMMLSRAIVRAREIAVRAAMGATRGQLVRQLLVESVLLSCLGGILGFAITAAGVHAFDLATRDVGKPYWVLFEIDYTVFGYFGAISIFSGILFGLVPALRASRVDLNTTLKDGTASAGSHRGGRLTGALVVFQFALTVILLAGAGMMIRGFFAAQAINPFIKAESLFMARVQLPEAKGDRYEDSVSRRQFYDELLPKLAALPGVSSVAATSNPPGLGAGTRDVEIEGRPNADPQQPARASMIIQTTDYLRTIGLPVLTGRAFAHTDGEPGKEAAIVTREFAAKYWPDDVAVGQRFRFLEKDKPPGVWITVIGVCADLVQQLQNDDAPPLVFIPYRQEPWGWMSFLLRTSSDPAALAAPVRAAVQAIDPELPLFEVRALPAALQRQRWFLVVFGTLFLIFALAGLLMASIGIYGVVAQATARRTREIGIRMALGATAGRIMQLVLSRGLRQLGLGLVLGFGGAAGATHIMSKGGLLVRVSPNDPLVFGAIAIVLLTIGLFACWLPARRAAALHPVAALRHE